jgi:uncharacterized protein YlxW (UPF0749 family)
MSVALRSDPITFGDLLDALDTAQRHAEEVFDLKAADLTDEIKAYREDVEELTAALKELQSSLDALVEARESAA